MLSCVGFCERETQRVIRTFSSLSSFDFHSPVVIVGGGPTGLMLSNLLSYNYKVPNVLFEAQSVDARFRHPQAHFLNTRTMEIIKHWLPDVYNRVLLDMPPVDHWKSFRFVTDMSQKSPLAEVTHPVDRPLQANCDANGILREDADRFIRNADLSVCCVGHLAQHTFGKILYDHACLQPESELFYGQTIKNITPLEDTRHIVESSDGQRILTDLVVAADGSASKIRRDKGIAFRGEEALQHLVNVHVRLSLEDAERLHEDGNHAMLYSTFSPEALSMVVCHSVGEYIIQIPYFHPYQSIQEDFSNDRLDKVIQAIFGEKVKKWEIVSSNSWVMSAQVADRYYTDDGVALVGDAAHVFPPAGGFGMNTGLQDAHNLAWKIAHSYHGNQMKNHVEIRKLLKSYHDERQPIAKQNAALSIRNYKRLVKVIRSFYLDEDHAKLTLGMMDYMPMSRSSRRSLFLSCLKMVMYPLSSLRFESAYTRHIKSGLRKTLKSGAGLPLLFPSFEIGFGYSKRNDINISQRTDSWGSYPNLQVGFLLPHVFLKAVSGDEKYPGLQFVDHSSKALLSSSDLPAQLKLCKHPCCVLLFIGIDAESVEIAENITEHISQKVSLPVEVVHLINDETRVPTGDKLVLYEEIHLENQSFSFFGNGRKAYMILIRPDGHVACILNDLEDFSANVERLAGSLYHINE